MATIETRELRKQLKAQQRLGVDTYDEPRARQGRGPTRGGPTRGGYAESARGGRAASPPRRMARHPAPQSEVAQDYYTGPAAETRGGSVPPNYTWPQFIADFTHAMYHRDKQETQTEVDHEEDPDRVLVADATVDAPAPVRNFVTRDERDDHKKDAEDDGYGANRDNYNDDQMPMYNARELVQDEHNGGNRATDEISVRSGHRGDERQGPRYDSYAAKGGRGHPLIYVNIATDHQEPYSNRERFDDDGRTPGRN